MINAAMWYDMLLIGIIMLVVFIIGALILIFIPTKEEDTSEIRESVKKYYSSGSECLGNPIERYGGWPFV